MYRKNSAAVRLGKMKSEAKAKAARENGALGGRPTNKTSIKIESYGRMPEKKKTRVELIFEKIEALEKKVESILGEDAPHPPRSRVENFWKNNNSFFVIAEHLLKIAMYPNHPATRQWWRTVDSHVLLVLRSTSERGNSGIIAVSKSVVTKLLKTDKQFEARINEEVNDAYNVAFLPHDNDQYFTSNITNFNTIREIGFDLFSYRDPKWGWNYAIKYNGVTEVDTNKRTIT